MRYARDVIQSGSTIPVEKVTTDSLYKIVLTGGTPNDYTPYWFSQSELNSLRSDPQNAMDRLGLPLQSHGDSFDVFEIRPNSEATVFESTIAPTRQGGVIQSGGITQTLVPDRTQFSTPEKVDSIWLGER